MKKFFCAILPAALGMALVQSASAADMAVKAPPRIAAPVAYDWSGFYIGGHAGWGWGRDDIGDSSFLGVISGAPSVQSVKADGFLGGGQVGWNYQIGRLVVGSEFDLSWTDIKGSATDPIFGGFGTITRDWKNDWNGTATVRLGVTPWDRVLLYSKAGVAYGHFKYTDTVVGLGTLSASASDHRTGWTVGTGLEWAFINNWSAKIEYDYIDYGNHTVNLPFFGGGLNIPLDMDQHVSLVKVGLNYRFGGGFFGMQ